MTVSRDGDRCNEFHLECGMASSFLREDRVRISSSRERLLHTILASSSIFKAEALVCEVGCLSHSDAMDRASGITPIKVSRIVMLLRQVIGLERIIFKALVALVDLSMRPVFLCGTNFDANWTSPPDSNKG